MKVKIGPYSNWFGPYQLAEKLMFWVPKEKDEYGFPHTAKRVHNFGEWLAHGSVEPDPEVGQITKMWEDRPITWLYRFLRWIDSFKKRKIHVHIDRWDTWNMNDTLGHIIRPMLKQLYETKHGSPWVDPDDTPSELRPIDLPDDSNGYTDDTHHERWDYVIREMIFAFESLPGGVNEDWEQQFETGEYDLQWEKQENGMSRMVHGPNHTADTDWKARNKYSDRITNGFRLFGKYYQNLWD